MPQTFFERLQARVDSIDSLLCVGLDPHIKELGADASAEGAYKFCKRLIDATHEYAAAYKPNAAFFECFGPEGITALVRVIKDIPAGIPVVLDVKRGDISTTAEAYADAAYKALGADCVTVNGYMGIDSVAPFSSDATKGVFVLCKTSNPSSSELQTLPTASGEQLYETVARLATTTWNANKNVGLVVGATDTDALRGARAAAPECWILAPGVGFQGGDLPTALQAGLRTDGSGLLLPVSRGISKASDPASAAKELRDAINAGRKAYLEAKSTAVAGSTAAAALPEHARQFFAAALAAGVLRFGSFTLKSGRQSPYFFNAGNFRTGASLAALGETYARTIQSSGIAFDVLFGPAYKGIPLVTTAAVALAKLGRDVPVAYNRKEAKDHGEGGTMVGADVKGQRVLIVDDVISAGTAVGEAIAIIQAAGGIPAGVVIGLDRQEKGSGDSPLSAVQQVQATYGIPVVAVANLTSLIGYVTEQAAASGTGKITAKGLEDVALPQLLEAVHAYRAQYGVDA